MQETNPCQTGAAAGWCEEGCLPIEEYFYTPWSVPKQSRNKQCARETEQRGCLQTNKCSDARYLALNARCRRPTGWSSTKRGTAAPSAEGTSSPRRVNPALHQTRTDVTHNLTKYDLLSGFSLPISPRCCLCSTAYVLDRFQQLACMCVACMLCCLKQACPCSVLRRNKCESILATFL